MEVAATAVAGAELTGSEHGGSGGSGGAALAAQPAASGGNSVFLRLETSELLSSCGEAGSEWAHRHGASACKVGTSSGESDEAGSALASYSSGTSSSSLPSGTSTSGAAARVAYLRLQTSTILADCTGEGAQWLLPADSSAAVASQAAPEPAADVGAALAVVPEAAVEEGAALPPAAPAVQAAAAAAQPAAAAALAAEQHAAAAEHADSLEDPVPDPAASAPSSAAAEFFQLLPLPPLADLPCALPAPPPAQHAEQLPLQQEQQDPAWRAGAWGADLPEGSRGSGQSLATHASTTAGAALQADGGRCQSAASAALSSPAADQLPYLAEQAADGAAGTAPGASGDAAGADSSRGAESGCLLDNAAYEPGAGGASAACPADRSEDDSSPTAQLARLLGSPLTPDSTHAGAVNGGHGVASGRAVSVGSGGRAARITPGASPAGFPPPEAAWFELPATSAAVAGSSGFAKPGPPARSLSQPLLQAEVRALQLEAAEMREALAAAEAEAAAYSDQAALLRGQAGSCEERQLAAQRAQQAAHAALGAALAEQAAAQHQAEAEAAARRAAEERQGQLEEQLELLLLERASAEELAGLPGDAVLASTAAELAAGNALMAEVRLLRRQLEDTSAGKHQLADALRQERSRSTALQARLSAAQAAAGREAHRHSDAEELSAMHAAATQAAQQQQVQYLAAQLAAAQMQLQRERASLSLAAAAASQQQQQQQELADQSVLIADLQRQLRAEQAQRAEHATLADAAAEQVTRQAAAFSEALLQQQSVAVQWQQQAEELARQLDGASRSEREVKSALQETCTKLVAQQQLCHEQQEELHFLRLKYQELSARLELAEGGAGGAANGRAATHTAVQQVQGPGSAEGSTGKSGRHRQRPELERASAGSSVSGGTPTGSRLRREGSGGSGGSRFGSWPWLRK